ncbi:hypothetical protein FisN_13Hu237 [Fistulifera solaris]|uniref:MYND-type domain-containing protein n=1 Tax=Fistulifera solaris TaxID=1519565 RepID=A0A1Z5KP07_FISSO|nr:hypothetical protein FisN_13Hu237 [Fistulifera solaris]|eukprot:GAX27668.1 hypothetical protein FisN_13Hu237 [Fistulifera solaris]
MGVIGVDSPHGTDKLPSYEGKDPFFQEEPWCVYCHSRPAAGLRCCSGCHTAWYCNQTCQKAHYVSGHKEICLLVAQDVKRVKKYAAPLRKMRVNDVLEDYFETQVGDFGQCPKTQMYLAARHALMDTYETAASEVKIQEVYEKALFHALAVLRLDAEDGIETRYVAPFILLNLHPDDDAFDFIRYWMKVSGQETTEEFWVRLQSEEGEWTYPREKDCRFLNIYQEVPAANEHNVPLAFLMAILIIKLRIVATYDATCRSIDLAFQTTGGRRIHMIQNAVKDIFLGDRVKIIENQRQQVE